MSQLYADVIVDITSEQVDRTFQYRIPDILRDKVREGIVVRIPFGKGNRTIKGYVIAITDQTKYDPEKIKEILSVESSEETVESKLIQLAAWMKENYGSTMIQALKTVLPVKKQVQKKEERHLVLHVTKEEGEAYLQFCLNHHYTAKARAVAAVLDQQRIAYETLTKEYKVTVSVVKSLIDAGILSLESKEIYRAALKEQKCVKKNILTEKQMQIADAVSEEWIGRNRPCLIHGITGSGKTSIYMELIARVTEKGQQVIFLIPEIALTRQMIQRLLARFGSGISFLNSHMTQAERYDQFKAAKRGDVQIMVGPRSALFTPFSNLGLIIIDEEHETTYISENTPRYHARETAVRRAEIEGARVVLGSATPSIDSYFAGRQGVYRLFTIQERYGTSRLPDVSVIDMRLELKAGNRSILSMELQDRIAGCLKKKEQVMLFLNRRGYAGFVSCRSCGYVVKCPHCEVSLSSHNNGKMICHYCGYERKAIDHCPECGSAYVGGFKAGTQKIETIVKKIFPTARVLRMDLDTTRGKQGHARIIESFEKQEADILIGTQMIVKGHDFPNVTLVGVLAADMSLNHSDYRAAERTFQLVTQAVGRAGRGKRPGSALIQTYNPEHYSIVHAMKQDYVSFYEEEIAYRMLMDYPPVGNLVAVCCSGEDEKLLETAVEYLTKFAKGICGDKGFQLIGPARPQVSKVRDIHRRVLYVKHTDHEMLVWIKNQLERYVEINSGYQKITVQFDFNT